MRATQQLLLRVRPVSIQSIKQNQGQAAAAASRRVENTTAHTEPTLMAQLQSRQVEYAEEWPSNLRLLSFLSKKERTPGVKEDKRALLHGLLREE